MVSGTTDSAVGLRRHSLLVARAAGRTRTVTAWSLKPLTLPLVYGGMTRRSSFVPPRGFEPPLHGISGHRLCRWSTAANSIVRSLVQPTGFEPVRSCPQRPLTLPVGLRRHSLRRPESHRRGLAYETWLRTRTLPAQPWWERWDSHPVDRRTTVLRTAPVTLPSTLPWGDRRDLHPLTRGSRPRASTTSASTTVRLEGIAPTSLGYRPSALLLS